MVVNDVAGCLIKNKHSDEALWIWNDNVSNVVSDPFVNWGDNYPFDPKEYNGIDTVIVFCFRPQCIRDDPVFK